MEKRAPFKKKKQPMHIRKRHKDRYRDKDRDRYNRDEIKVNQWL